MKKRGYHEKGHIIKLKTHNNKSMSGKGSVSKTSEKPVGKTNKATEKAGLHFNVNETKKWMKNQFTLSDEPEKKVLFQGAHIALTAACEALCNNLMSLVVKELPKEVSGLYTLTSSHMIYAIQNNSDYISLFRNMIEKFDPDTNYTSMFWIERKVVDRFIESRHGTNIKLDSRAYNFMAFLLNSFAVTTTRAASVLMKYSKRSSMNIKTIRAAIEIIAPDTVSNSLAMRIDECATGTGEDEEDSENEGAGSGESADEGEAAPAPSKSGKGAARKPAVAAKKEESDSESESESESDAEEPAKAPAKGKAKAAPAKEPAKEKETVKAKPVPKKAAAAESESETSDDSDSDSDSESEPETKKGKAAAKKPAAKSK